MPAKKEEVIAQIRVMLQEGESVEAITRTLISAGWTKDEIAAVLKAAVATGEPIKTEEKTISPETDKTDKNRPANNQAKNETPSNTAQPQKQSGNELKVVAIAIAATILLLIAGIGAYFLYPYLNGDNTQRLCNCDSKELTPVCAKDGNTYKSECKLNCAKAEKDYNGECKRTPSATATPKPTEETPPTLTEIPEPTDEAIPPFPNGNTPAEETATPTSFPFSIPPAGENLSGGEMPPLPG